MGPLNGLLHHIKETADATTGNVKTHPFPASANIRYWVWIPYLAIVVKNILFKAIKSILLYKNAFRVTLILIIYSILYVLSPQMSSAKCEP